MLLQTYVAVGAAYVRGEAVADGDGLSVTGAGRRVRLVRPLTARLRGWVRGGFRSAPAGQCSPPPASTAT